MLGALADSVVRLTVNSLPKKKSLGEFDRKVLGLLRTLFSSSYPLTMRLGVFSVKDFLHGKEP